MDDVGGKIKYLRTSHNMTQKQLAEKLFVTPQAVSKWENNQVTPSLDKLTDLAKLFDVNVQNFFDMKTIENNNDFGKWWLLVFNTAFYAISLVCIYLLSPKINHDILGMVITAVIFFGSLGLCIEYLKRHQIRNLYRYILGSSCLNIIWLICIYALFTLK